MNNYLILYFLIAYLIHGWAFVADWADWGETSITEIMWLIFAPLSLIVYGVVFLVERNLK